MHTILDHSILAKTRAEEHDADVWGKFFIPPYFERLALKRATKSTYLIGKRGCGKTMLLKYLDYHTLFSKKRDSIPQDEIKHIGIYWRVDTQFCNSLKSRGIDEESWISIFESYFSLVISTEILRSITAISESSYQSFNEKSLKEIKLESAKDFHPSFPSTVAELEQFLEAKRRSFSLWISNVTAADKPLLPPGKIFIESIIADIKKSSGLEESAFYIYVDEVENLAPYQKRVLNSLLKHSQKPFIVSFTSKEISYENMTTGPESINATHDYKLENIDELMTDQERECFFAEVFLGNLDLAAGIVDSPLLSTVRDQASLEQRQSISHRESILKKIKTKLPSKEYKEFAKAAVKEQRIRKILDERIERALQRSGSKVSCNDFLDPGFAPEAVVILPALLNRKALACNEVLSELKKYSETKGGKFSDWVHNNLVGSLLELYRPYRQACPLYSGFDTFYTMANRNLRHFLILCYKALELTEIEGESDEVFEIETQARASFEAADQLIREIKTFGELGERLRIFVLRLGSIFRALQATPNMSEPEQNQFTINSGGRPLNEDEVRFLSEAQKYAILMEKHETKTKGSVGTDITDYQLNPIYAPYFLISYRRKRKIELSVEDFHTLAMGTENDYKALSSSITKTSNADKDLQLGLQL